MMHYLYSLTFNCILNKLHVLPICVMKHADLTGVDPESETALTSAPWNMRHFITSKFPDTAAHHSGVTQCTDLSSGTSYFPLCSMSASHFFMRYSTISTWPLLQAMNNGAQPSFTRDTISFRISLLYFSKRFLNA